MGRDEGQGTFDSMAVQRKYPEKFSAPDHNFPFQHIKKALDMYAGEMYNTNVAFRTHTLAELAEWSKAHDWKSCAGLYPAQGSNP